MRVKAWPEKLVVHEQNVHGEAKMVFQHAEDIDTLKKVGINVAALVVLMFFLIVVSVIVG